MLVVVLLVWRVIDPRHRNLGVFIVVYLVVVYLVAVFVLKKIKR